MSRRERVSPALRKPRTTLRLPAASLFEAQRIARVRRVNLSTVVAQALADGLRLQTVADRSEAVLDRYRKAFSEFSDEEIAVLDGVIPETVAKH
ncbi:MAG TPA: hypothetical protein VME43_18895 [Bryobacteraceae bacterium]|nr:hypothetical protein [Bryobacteraceae bacterium]